MIENLDIAKLEKTFENVVDPADPNLLYEAGDHDHAGVHDHDHGDAHDHDHIYET